jgi:hypothetical protein
MGYSSRLTKTLLGLCGQSLAGAGRDGVEFGRRQGILGGE